MSVNNNSRNRIPELYPARVESNAKGILLALLSLVVAIVALALIYTFFSYTSPKSINYGKTWGFISGGSSVAEEIIGVTAPDDADTADTADTAQTENSTVVQDTTTTEEATESVPADTGAESADVAADAEMADVAATDSGDYIFSDSSERLLTSADLEGKSDWELRVARNEIFARHGRKFDSQELVEYFNSKSWYNGTIEPDDFDYETMLTDIERANIKMIESYEN